MSETPQTGPVKRRRHISREWPPDADAYLSVKALAQYAGLCERTIRSYILSRGFSSGLPHYRVGNRILIKKSEYDAWMKQFVWVEDGWLKRTMNEVVAELDLRQGSKRPRDKT